MKRRLCLALSALILPLFSLFAQQHRSPEIEALLREDLDRASVYNHAYEFKSSPQTPPPSGYKPVYISHYGRHGARSDWAGPAYKMLVDWLREADGQDLLTEDGKTLLSEAAIVNDRHNGMDGRLTEVGVNEHRALAERMYRNYPSVFKKGSGRVRSISSTTPRCLVSMTAFTDRLTELRPDLYISWDTGEAYMKYIKSDCPEDVKKASGVLLDNLQKEYTPDTVSVMERLFKDPAKAGQIIPSSSTLQFFILHTAKVGESFGLNGNLYRFLPFDAVYQFYEGNAMDIFLRHANSVEYGLRRVPLAEPLVEDIVTKADEALSGGQWCADLRFGHDYPLLTLVAYLGVEGPGDRYTLDEARDKWLGFRNIPFASNLQIIFYRNKQGNVLVKFLYNEEERLLRGLAPLKGPYYRWEDVKANLKGYLR